MIALLGRDDSTDRATEQALLGSLAPGLVVPTAVVAAGEDASAEQLRDLFGSTPTWVLVRTPSTSDASFAALVLVDPASPASAALDAALSCADACFGVSASRFASTLGDRARIGVEPGADEALSRLAGTSGAKLPPPSWSRVVYVMARARNRAPRSGLLLQAIHPAPSFGCVTSRDPRSGSGPARVLLGASPRALLESPVKDRAIDACEALGDASKDLVRQLASSLEVRVERPVRVSFTRSGDAIRVVGITLLRRFGLASFALVADLLERGAIASSRAVELIDRRDVGAAVPLRIEVEEGTTVVEGIAAGTGIVEGIVCLSPSDALAMARSGFVPILFTHDLFPDDVEAVRSCGGVVAIRGGLTGEAAVIARGLSKPCVASGAALSLADDQLRIAHGGVLSRGERVTIDGSTGLIARGAHPIAVDAVPEVVSRVLEAQVGRGRVYACVEHPAHVKTAERLGAAGVAIGRAERMIYEALRAGGDGSFDRAIAASVRAVFDAASGVFSQVLLRSPAAVTLPHPIGRPASALEVDALGRACAEASAATGVGFDQVAELELPVSPPADLLAARIEAARRDPPGK